MRHEQKDAPDGRAFIEPAANGHEAIGPAVHACNGNDAAFPPRLATAQRAGLKKPVTRI